MGGYEISIERGDLNFAELEPIYRQHYGEMKSRLDADGVPIGEFNMRIEAYFEAWSEGWLINYVARKDGRAVGYCNVYLTDDMHNSERIAQEDALYVLPEHRRGVGRDLVKFALADLEARGVKRVHITPVTDLRVGKIWKRMGFKEVATQMMYVFEGN